MSDAVNQVFGQLMQLQRDVRAGEAGAGRRHKEVIGRLDQTMSIALKAAETAGKAVAVASEAVGVASEAKTIAIATDKRVTAMAKGLRRWRRAAIPLAVFLLGVGFVLGRVTREACEHRPPVAEARKP